MKKLELKDVDFKIYWDPERVYFHADYRGKLKSQLSIRRPFDLHDGFLESDQVNYFKNKLLILIQFDLDMLNA